jgi:hypothetical protein
MKKTLTILAMCCLCPLTAMAAWTERYVDDAAAGGGDGSTAATSGGSGAWTFAEAVAIAHAAGIRINIKTQADTEYDLTTTDLTVAANSADSAGAVWWRGYNTTIGDIDSNNSLAKPLIKFTTGHLDIAADFNLFSNLSFEGASTTVTEGVVEVTAPDCRLWRCRFNGTAADADCVGLTFTSTGDRSICSQSYFVTNAAADCARIEDDAFLVGCYLKNGLNGVLVSGGPCAIIGNVFESQAGDAVRVNAQVGAMVYGNTMHASGSDSVELVAATNSAYMINNVFSDATVYAVNSSAGASSVATLQNNSYYSSGTADLNNVYESQQIGNVTETGSPFVNAGASNFAIADGALSISAGFPGTLENSSLIGYPDLGALQREPSSGGMAIDPIQLSQ